MATISFINGGFLSSQKSSCQRFEPLLSRPKCRVADRSFSPANRRYLSSGNRRSQHGNRSKTVIVYSGDQVGDLLPVGVTLPENWPLWLTGVLLALVVVPFVANNWDQFAKYKAEIDKVEEVVDNMADRVEELAENVEEFVGDIAGDLPEGNSFRQTLEKVENAADTIGKKAKVVSDVVEKMDEMEAKMESMFEKANEKKKIVPTNVEP